MASRTDRGLPGGGEPRWFGASQSALTVIQFREMQVSTASGTESPAALASAMNRFAACPVICPRLVRRCLMIASILPGSHTPAKAALKASTSAECVCFLLLSVSVVLVSECARKPLRDVTERSVTLPTLLARHLATRARALSRLAEITASASALVAASTADSMSATAPACSFESPIVAIFMMTSVGMVICG